MQTKYENFLQHLIHGIDEPKKTFGKFHHMMGFETDKFFLKGKVLSATKIFLSDDFVKKRFYDHVKKTYGFFKNEKPHENLEVFHNKLFMDSLPLYDNLLILFPYLIQDQEFMGGCWIRKIIPSKHFNGIPRNFIKSEKYIYQITTFDDACKLVNEPKRLNLALTDYMVDFQGGIGRVRPEFDTGKNQVQEMLFGKYDDKVQKSFMRFIDILPSFIHKQKLEPSSLQKVFAQVDTPQSQLSILFYLNLLNFINEKGSETITFKSSLPIKKRSNIQKGFEYKMLEVKKANRITTRYGDSINKNRLHWVRRHTRQYKNGKTITIHPHQRGDEKMGIIIKDYNFK